MTDPLIYLTLAAAALTGLGMLTFAGLAGWRGWLQLQQQALRRDEPASTPQPTVSARIEIADLKERIRKLEAIAAGVDL